VPCLCALCDEDEAKRIGEQRRDSALRRAEAASEITPRFRERVFEKFDVEIGTRAAFDAAQRVARDPKRGVGLYGPFGIGKSHLAAAIVNACMANGVAARFVSVDDLLGSIRATFDGKHGNESEILAGYVTVPVLALDDLGKEALTDWAVRTLFALVNRRYEQSLPLIITSNLSPRALASRKVADGADPLTYASIMDRTREMVGTWIAMSGTSKRTPPTEL
jgi:DNA replication protein DnaC